MLKVKGVYFLGIGGIGMSALARYFIHMGKTVAGYDRTPSPITNSLQKEGISILYDDSPSELPAWLSPAECLIVWTPAVSSDTELYKYLNTNGYVIKKRSEVLGDITHNMRALCVAGTHGKTTTSTLIAHLFNITRQGINAFLGGISLNENSNLILSSESERVVVEADEYDRSFLRLHPAISVITSIDPDHLDIYGTAEKYQEGFDEYARLVKEIIILKKGYQVHNVGCEIRTYSAKEKADYYADNIHYNEGRLYFDFHVYNSDNEQHIILNDMELGVPAWINVENAVAALAVAWEEGLSEAVMREGLRSFRGVYRRFNIHVQSPTLTFIDDYAHHPMELSATIASTRRLYHNNQIIGIFQPHLFTRTRDFMDDFAVILGTMDRVILLPIYPARELPIEGVTSYVLAKKIGEKAVVVSKEDILQYIDCLINKNMDSPTTLLTLGAGDIDRLVEPISTIVKKYAD